MDERLINTDATVSPTAQGDDEGDQALLRFLEKQCAAATALNEERQRSHGEIMAHLNPQKELRGKELAAFKLARESFQKQMAIRQGLSEGPVVGDPVGLEEFPIADNGLLTSQTMLTHSGLIEQYLKLRPVPEFPTNIQTYGPPFRHCYLMPSVNETFVGTRVADRQSGLISLATEASEVLVGYLGVTYSMPVNPLEQGRPLPGGGTLPPPYREAEIVVIADLSGWKRWFIYSENEEALCEGDLNFSLSPSFLYPETYNSDEMHYSTISRATNKHFSWHNKVGPKWYGDIQPFGINKTSYNYASKVALPGVATSPRIRINNYCSYKVLVGLRIAVSSSTYREAFGAYSMAKSEMEIMLNSITIFQYG